jgi:hypothetical protein
VAEKIHRFRNGVYGSPDHDRGLRPGVLLAILKENCMGSSPDSTGDKVIANQKHPQQSKAKMPRNMFNSLTELEVGDQKGARHRVHSHYFTNSRLSKMLT